MRMEVPDFPGFPSKRRVWGGASSGAVSAEIDEPNPYFFAALKMSVKLSRVDFAAERCAKTHPAQHRVAVTIAV